MGEDPFYTLISLSHGFRATRRPLLLGSGERVEWNQSSGLRTVR